MAMVKPIPKKDQKGYCIHGYPLANDWYEIDSTSTRASVRRVEHLKLESIEGPGPACWRKGTAAFFFNRAASTPTVSSLAGPLSPLPSSQ